MVLLGWGLAFAAAWALSALADRSTARSVSIAVLVLEPLFLLVWMWSVTGTTVSALRTLFAGPSRLWAIIALLFIALSVIAATQELRRLGPALKEHWAVAAGKQPAESFSITLSVDGRVIEFSGGVNDGAAAAIDRAIADAPKVGTLLLNSPGGWLREGKRMADVVKRYRLNTRVDQECFSACTLVLLAGENRSAGEAAQIGFHRGRSVGESSEQTSRPASGDEAEIYQKAGLRDAFVRHIVSTANDSIWIPTRRELLHEDVLTR
jgi:membrane-bound ClpP family serine protease